MRRPRGARGSFPEGASSFTGLEGRQDVHVHDPHRLPVQQRCDGHGGATTRSRSTGARPRLQSPAFQFIADANATNIVGAQAVRDGNAAKASRRQGQGQQVDHHADEGRTRPSSPKITMPFFQALPTNLSRTDKVINVNAGHPLRRPVRTTSRPRAEPARHDQEEPELREGRLPQVQAATGEPLADQHQTVVNLEASYQEVKANQADYTYGLPPTASRPSSQAKFGINKGRFRVTAVELRQLRRDELGERAQAPRCSATTRAAPAVNYVDRPQGDGRPVRRVRRQADRPVPARRVPGLQGASARKGYPITSNVSRARSSRTATTKSGERGSTTTASQLLARSAWSSSGAQPAADRYRRSIRRASAGSRSTTRPASATRRTHSRPVAGARTTPDPYDFINVLLYGGTSRTRTTTTSPTSTTPLTTRGWSGREAHRCEAPEGVRQPRRSTDHEAAAPWAAWNQPTNRVLLQQHVWTRRAWSTSALRGVDPYNIMALK